LTADQKKQKDKKIELGNDFDSGTTSPKTEVSQGSNRSFVNMELDRSRINSDSDKKAEILGKHSISLLM
jgi:hypothetical protein